MKVGDYVSLIGRAPVSGRGFSVRVRIVEIPERPLRVRREKAPVVVLIHEEELEVMAGDLSAL